MCLPLVFPCSPGSGSCRFSYSDPSITVSYSLGGNANTSDDWITLEKIRSLSLTLSLLAFSSSIPQSFHLLQTPALPFSSSHLPLLICHFSPVCVLMLHLFLFPRSWSLGFISIQIKHDVLTQSSKWKSLFVNKKNKKKKLMFTRSYFTCLFSLIIECVMLFQSSYQQQHSCPPAASFTFIQRWCSSTSLVSGDPPWTWRLWVLLGFGQCAAGQLCSQSPTDGGQLGPSRHC